MAANDIIAAIATAPGRGGIGVIRISGPHLRPFAAQLLAAVPSPRYATHTHFLDAENVALDQGIALYFPAPYSYTGEDVLELQGHGGPIVQQLLLERCLQLGARIALPGEFTRRAFLADKLDLAQAESVADLINATTAQAARGAMRSLQGEFSIKIQGLVTMLVELRALVEATLDFPEEEIDFLKRADATGRLEKITQQLAAVLQAAQKGSLLREGARVVLVGQPNAGKSSLLNRLAGEDLAIVTEIPGTTRDAITQTLTLDGIPLQLTDTAGLRESVEPIETLGIARTWAAIDKAEVILLLVDATKGETAADQAIRARFPGEVAWIRVMNKIDLMQQPPQLEEQEGVTTVWVSAETGAGLDLLKQALLKAIGWRGAEQGLYLARTRHLYALRVAQDYLQQASQQPALELLAEELRLAQQALSSITGEFTPEELLGEIFSRFCIGK